MLIDIKIIAVLIKQADIDWDEFSFEVTVDLLAYSRQEGLHDITCGGLELHSGHEQDMGNAIVLVNDTG